MWRWWANPWDDCCFPLQGVDQFVVSMVSSMYQVVTTHLQMNLTSELIGVLKGVIRYLLPFFNPVVSLIWKVFNPGEVATTHYLYEVAWGISWPHGKETISFYIWVTSHMYLCLYVYIRNTLACFLNLYPNYTTVTNFITHLILLVYIVKGEWE